MSFKQNRILMMTFVETHFGVMSVYEFITKANFYEDICWVSVWRYESLWVQTKANSYEDICWASFWSYVNFWVSNESELWWRHLFSFSLKFFMFMSFKSKQILKKTFVGFKFEVMYVYGFQTKSNSYEDISSVSVWSSVSLWVSNKCQFLRRHLLGLSLKLFKFMTFRQKQILMKTFVESQFEII